MYSIVPATGFVLSCPYHSTQALLFLQECARHASERSALFLSLKYNDRFRSSATRRQRLSKLEGRGYQNSKAEAIKTRRHRLSKQLIPCQFIYSCINAFYYASCKNLSRHATCTFLSINKVTSS